MKKQQNPDQQKIQKTDHSSGFIESQPSKAPEIEIGGYDGPEPTRYNDWEKNGRCIDF